MRIDRLNLMRFGKFTDRMIDFGPIVGGQPDIHLIYGPNEAGKSTLLAAFLDLLFGIEVRTRYNFIHDNRTMRIGATLALNAGVHDLIRIKSQQNSLLNGAGQPVSDTVLRGDLGSIDRESYRAMFSLDDDSLESGGEDIIASRGDVGRLLYAASAGVTDLSQNIAAVREIADRFYRPGTRAHELYGLKQQLAALKTERDSIDVLATEYVRLRAQHKLLRSRYDAALNDRSAVRSRQAEIQRLLAAQPRLAALHRLRAQLAPLGDPPAAPPQWQTDLPGLRDDEVQLATKLAINADDTANLTTDLNAITINQTALDAGGAIAALSELRARHITAAADIPLRQAELETADLKIRQIVSRIGCPDTAEPDDLIIAAGPQSALKDLIETRSGIETALATATVELAAAVRGLDEATSELAASGGSPIEDDGRIVRLGVTIATIQRSDHATRHRLANQAHAEHLETLSHRLRDLNPWFGDIAMLLTMSVPGSGEIEQFKHARTAAEAERRTHAASVARLTSEHRRRAAEVEALGTIPGVVPDQAVSRSRAARDEAWVTHRRLLDATSADAFETAMRQDDALLSDRHTHGAEVAKRRQAERDVAILAADLRSAIEQAEGASASLAEVNADIAAAIAQRTPGLPADTTIEQWEEFIHRRAKAVEASERAAAQQRLMANAATDGDIARSRLMAAFDTAEIPYDRTAAFEGLLTAASLVIERETEVKGLRSAVRKATKTLADRQRQAALAQQRDSSWCVAWATACASCWLGADGKVPPLAEVRTILADLGDLPAALLLRAGLRSRIVAMEQDQADFNAGIASIARTLGIAHESRHALETAAAIDRMIEVATHAQAEHAKLMRQHDAARRQQRELQRALDEHQKRKAEMTMHFGVDTLHDVGLMLERLATRRALQDQADQAIVDILNLLTLSSIEAAEAALDPFDRVALETEAADLAARFDDCDEQTRTLSTAYTLVRDRIDAIGGDDAVARIESKRRTLNLEIDAKATDYLCLRIGIAAAEQALRLYRDRHRSSMMQNASAAFATISRGAYARLDTQVEKDREVLVAIGTDGGSKLASELSKGTRFQLYLALRVAGYREFSRTRPSLPFIADDILETFDDFRAEEAFRLFADMAAVGQVIYLTHHRHLIEIARQICPDIHVHTLA